MSLFSKIRGTIETLWQIGLGGPNLKNNAGVVEARNASDSAFAVVRGAVPAGDNDFVTKAYADKVANKPTPVTLQFNGGSALPSNTATEQWYVVTTSGANATIGQLLWDDGSGSGTVAVIPAVNGNSLVTSAALTGGTISLAATSLYIWNGSAWTNVAPSVPGSLNSIRMAVTTAASQSSATQIPANAIIYWARMEVGATAFSAGSTASLGITGSTALFMGTGDNLTTVANQLYELPQATSVGASAAALLVTIGGAPSVGGGFATVIYSVPNS